jgi:NAD(P)-dependent dehydrogenase (short-subunit alcohol dehydrogenase family)
MDLLDINLNGCIYFARIALAYLHAGSDNSEPPSKGLTLISSAAAFQEAPGMPGYASSKVGILGLMRSIRSLAPKMCNTRVNVIAPWATDTAMVKGHTHLFTENNIPLQSPDDVVVFTQYVTADPVINGKTVYVGGARGFDIEEGLDRTLPQWLGQVNADLWKQQARAFARVNLQCLHAQG